MTQTQFSRQTPFTRELGPQSQQAYDEILDIVAKHGPLTNARPRQYKSWLRKHGYSMRLKSRDTDVIKSGRSGSSDPTTGLIERARIRGELVVVYEEAAEVTYGRQTPVFITALYTPEQARRLGIGNHIKPSPRGTKVLGGPTAVPSRPAIAHLPLSGVLRPEQFHALLDLTERQSAEIAALQDRGDTLTKERDEALEAATAPQPTAAEQAVLDRLAAHGIEIQP